MIGIYKIENKINGKVYIGQSMSIETRFNQHKNCSRNKNYQGYDCKFYRALRKYGIENFEFSVVEECSKEELNDKETFYIQKYNSYYEGYNSTTSSENVTERAENHPKAKLTNNKVLEIKNMLLNTACTEYEIAEKYGISQSIISEINLGEKWVSVRR